MATLICFSIFLFGLAVGSFLNCVIYRLETDQSFLRGRSLCPYCRHILSWQDLIPLLSFFILRGKCRYCQKSISFQYPLVEMATGLLFLLIFNFFIPLDMKLSNGTIFNFLDLIYYWIISCFLIIIFVYDLKHYIIPDKVVSPAIVITFLYNIFYSLFVVHNSKFLIQFLFSAFGAAAFFLLFILISRGAWMGGGDVKLVFLMGLVLGWPNIFVALFLTFLIGAIIGVDLILLGKKTLKSEIPLGPFLVFGTFIALFWGGPLINLYLDLINLG
ncbi:hypothetical protein AMJ48_00120 [Parcubacteria bacterium DG_74_1]|nr:MAG: hypothetical protein AMJ48_00120 [Parcubacteria bacterium DG_74_1]